MIAVFLAVLLYGFSVDTPCMTDMECMAYCVNDAADDCDGGPHD